MCTTTRQQSTSWVLLPYPTSPPPLYTYPPSHNLFSFRSGCECLLPSYGIFTRPFSNTVTDPPRPDLFYYFVSLSPPLTDGPPRGEASFFPMLLSPSAFFAGPLPTFPLKPHLPPLSFKICGIILFEVFLSPFPLLCLTFVFQV